MLLLFVLVVISSVVSSDREITTDSAAIVEPQTPTVGVDGDTTADTFNTLALQLRDMEDEMNTMRDELDRQGTYSESSPGIQDAITERINSLEEVFRELQDGNNLLGQLGNTGSDNQQGRSSFGSLSNGVPDSSYDPFAGDQYNSTFRNNISVTATGAQATLSSDGYVDILPLFQQSPGAVESNLNIPTLSENTAQSATTLYESFSETQGELRQSNRRLQVQQPIEPRYTIPVNATLYEATAMTAIIGRVPISGSVRDPFPLKLILGTENLAANGLRIPGLSGMIFAGQAIGDWNLSCVRADIYSATYIWDDGRIQVITDNTLSDTSRAGSRTSNSLLNEDSEGGEPIGWISSPQGVPCVPGERLSDAGTSSALQVLLALGEGYASAQAATQITSSVTGVGGSQSAVTGDPRQYYQNIATANAISEVGDIIRERWAGSFDAIFIAPGKQVAINITRTLPVDYNPDARKLAYANTPVQHSQSLD